MLLTTQKSTIIEKTEELCQTILDQPSFQDLRTKIDAFMGDEQAQQLYQDLLVKQEALRGKHQQGISLAQDEIEEFERDRDALFDNPVAKGYLDGQEQMAEVLSSVNKYISKTIELGRMPTEEDLSSGGGCGCGGGGCGCG